MMLDNAREDGADLLTRRQRAVPRGVASATAVFAQSAENARIEDVQGRCYVDFASGIGVVATGHCHPRIVEAVQAQLGRFSHTAFQVMAYESYIELAERLNALAPFSGEAKSVFFTTGAEAVENAIRIARIATGRQGIVAFSGAFHGRTFLTSSLTGKVAPYKQGLGTPAPDVYRVPFPAEYQNVSVEDSIRALESLFLWDLPPSRAGAIVIEPVQGEGGFHVAPVELLRALRRICDAHGILLVADEVQCGFGRTGKLFGVEHSGVEPDLITVAKSLAGGFPLSGVIGRAGLMDSIEPGGLGGTYGGSPLGCVAALAVLSVLQDENLLHRAQQIGQQIRSRLDPLLGAGRGRSIANLRGLGAMLAFDVLKQPGSAPDGAGAKQVVARALEQGLVVLTCGTHGETVRILPPLTISDEDLEQGLAILVEAVTGEDRGGSVNDIE